MSLVLSRKAHARILNVDPSEALQLAGVHSYIGHKDVQGQNICGNPPDDEEIFASEKVSFMNLVCIVELMALLSICTNLWVMCSKHASHCQFKFTLELVVNAYIIRQYTQQLF